MVRDIKNRKLVKAGKDMTAEVFRMPGSEYEYRMITTSHKNGCHSVLDFKLFVDAKNAALSAVKA